MKSEFSKIFSISRLLRRSLTFWVMPVGMPPHQLSYVTHSGEGEGLLFYGNTILPFIDHFPKETELYKVMTTKFAESVQEAS